MDAEVQGELRDNGGLITGAVGAAPPDTAKLSAATKL
jgi:hypothetical protein